MNLKQLNSTGRESFRAYLGALKAGEEPMVLPEMILSDDSQFESTHLVGELSLEEFPSRYAMGAHLVSLLSAYDLSELSGMDGLWDWVSLAWIDQLTKGKLDDEVNYIISGEYNRRYRHAVYFSWWLVYKYGSEAEFLLCKPPNTRGDLLEQLTSVQYLPNCHSFISAGRALYWDDDTKALKRGAGGKGAGSPRRFMAWIAQIELNYDLFEIGTQTLIEMLPAEFDRFKPV